MQLGNGDEVETTKDVKEKMFLQAKSFSAPGVLRMMKAFNNAAVDTRGGWQPSLSLELALAEVIEVRDESPGSAPAPAGGPERGPRLASAKATATKVAAANQPVKTESAEKPDGEALIGLAEIVKSWKDVRAVIKPVHPGIEALLNSCKPMDVRGDELILGFQSDKVLALMDRPEQLEVTRKAIADVLGVALQIKCVVTNAKGKLPPDVSQDGMVATALNHGGEIVDVQD